MNLRRGLQFCLSTGIGTGFHFGNLFSLVLRFNDSGFLAFIIDTPDHSAVLLFGFDMSAFSVAHLVSVLSSNSTTSIGIFSLRRQKN